MDSPKKKIFSAIFLSTKILYCSIAWFFLRGISFVCARPVPGHVASRVQRSSDEATAVAVWVLDAVGVPVGIRGASAGACTPVGTRRGKDFF